MKAVLEFFDASWLQLVGYTLLHSIWEAFIVAALIVLALRFIPNKLSTVRYITASVGVLTIICLSIGTFVYLYTTSPNETGMATVMAPSSKLKLGHEAVFLPVTTYLDSTRAFINSVLPLFLMVWILGTSLFSLRILTGLAYVEKLRRKSTLLENEWSRRVQHLARQLNINRIVLLAESHLIQAPVIIGHLKPMILIPLGMCTSLSTEQLETIFLHELTHIRRKDYLINLIQVVVEAIYFFNPFVWVLSEIIKREREHCCDDAVVQLHGNVKEYAHALATLEELRLSKAGLALSLAENKNQLLNRIKRLMEKSVKNYSSRERIIPALLLVIGLICASWISTHTSKTELASSNPDRLVAAVDTIKKEKKNKQTKKAETKSKEIAASKQDDKSDLEEDLDDAREFDTQYAKGYYQGPPIPLPPHFDFDIPAIPDVALTMPPFPDVLLNLDTPGFKFREHDWEEFSREFEENFKAKFEDFYEKHEADIQRMLEDVHDKVNSKFDREWEMKMEDFGAKWERKAALLSQQESMRSLERNLKHLNESHEAQQRGLERSHQAFEKSMKAFEEKNRFFEEKMKEQLIEDGYLGKDEKLETMHWHNGKIEINGKKIKPEDEKKYNEIHEQYFRGGLELRKFE